MADRSATTIWEGGLDDGHGRTTLDSSGLGTFDVSWPARTRDAAEGMTSPEELIAAAHASCFSMALSKQITNAGGTPNQVQTSATVTFESGTISTIALRVQAQVDGIDEQAFQKAAEAAKDGCPVSKLVGARADITLEASLS